MTNFFYIDTFVIHFIHWTQVFRDKVKWVTVHQNEESLNGMENQNSIDFVERFNSYVPENHVLKIM
jgi:hypothetical protein